MIQKEKPVVSLKNIWVKLSGRVVLENINLDIFPNALLAVIGPNGGGKTTLLKVIIGLIKPTKGKVLLFGKPPKEVNNLVGYVPQVFHTDPNFPINVLESVLLGTVSKNSFFPSYTKKQKSDALFALEQVNMLNYQARQIGQLSQGQRQRVFIARALCTKPKLLLLDEPTASADQSIQESVYILLDKLKKEIPIVMVTHDLSVVSKYVDNVACLNHTLFYHGGKELGEEAIEKIYGCHVDLIAHGHPHRVFKDH